MRTCMKEQPIATKDLAMLRKKTYVIPVQEKPEEGVNGKLTDLCPSSCLQSWLFDF